MKREDYGFNIESYNVIEERSSYDVAGCWADGAHSVQLLVDGSHNRRGDPRMFTLVCICPKRLAYSVL